jgi:bifunctional ADP-heptose synthase (sugar kinase/adenylyltransferase)
VFPIGVAGEDEGGQQIFRALHEHRISTSGISKIKNYTTPNSPEAELIHQEHPVLLNLIEHARKFVTASDAMYVCDYGVGAASARLVNFIKSNGCLREKTLAARSLHRLVDFEQLSAAIATGSELEKAIGITIVDDFKKLTVGMQGMLLELRAQSLVTITDEYLLAMPAGHKAEQIPLAVPVGTVNPDLLGAVYAAALSTGAEVRAAAELAARITAFSAGRTGGKRARHEELMAFLGHPAVAPRVH